MCKKNRLPPTQGALYEAILCALYQIIAFNNDGVCSPRLSQPDVYGWKKREEEWTTVAMRRKFTYKTCYNLRGGMRGSVDILHILKRRFLLASLDHAKPFNFVKLPNAGIFIDSY